MKQSCVSAFARAARRFALAAVALGFGAGSLLAQGSTGKIEGRVRDQAGAPIANAQVFIVGTAFNALTNPQGYYFINNVPAGTYSVRAAFIGYKSTQVDGVKVLAGQTSTVDIQLEQTAVQIQEITVVTQTQPLVPRDEVTSKQRLDGEVVAKLPVDRINNVLALQPGVVASRNTNQLSVRGGRVDQNATIIDGVPVSAGYRGTSQGATFQSVARGPSTQVEVSTDAFEQASVTTGATSSEYGNAQGGVISIETKTGGAQYSGTLGYENDFASGSSNLGLNRVTGGFGGPAGIHGLTFYVSGTLSGQQSIPTGKGAENLQMFVPAGIDTTVAVPASNGTDTTIVPVREFALVTGDCNRFSASPNTGIASNYGVSCKGSRLPQTARSQYQASAKLNYSYGGGSRLSLSGLRSQDQGRFATSDAAFSTGVYPTLTNPQNLFGYRNWSNVVTLNWTQQLTKSTERALALESFLSYQQDRTITSPLSERGYRTSLDPFGGYMIGGLDFLYNFDNFPINDELINNFRTNTSGSRRRPIALEDLSVYIPTFQYRTNPYGMAPANRTTASRPDAGFPAEESGGPGGNGNIMSLYRENRLLGKANLDWQFDRYNRLRFGGEFTRYDLKYFGVELTNELFSDAYKEKPVRWGGYVEDRLDLGDVVVVGGLRYDWYDSRALRPSPFPVISTAPGFDPANPTALLVRDKSHHYLSPHVQVSFPVTERTNFRLSYAHQVQAPDFGAMLTGINTDLNTTNPNQLYGSDLDFGRTIAFEFGVRHAFSDDMVLDVAAYNRDVLSDAAGRTVKLSDPTAAGVPKEVRVLQNADFGNTRGIDVRLDRRFGNYFSGTLAYTYQQAKNTGDDPLTYIAFGSRIVSALAGGNTPPPQAILSTASSRPHTIALAGSLTFPADWKKGTTVGSILGNFGVYATGRYTSGTAYSSCVNTAENSVLLAVDNSTPLNPCSTGDFTSEINGVRLPAFKALDMRFTKGFGLRGLNLTAYADVRNILNFTNVIRRYMGTNDITNAVEFTADSAIAAGALQGEADANALLDPATGNIDLTFAGAGASGCGSYTSANGSPAPPSCVYLIRVEQRFGNGDGIYTPDEQNRAFTAFYQSYRGRNFFTDRPRQVRLGLEVNF